MKEIFEHASNKIVTITRKHCHNFLKILVVKSKIIRHQQMKITSFVIFLIDNQKNRILLIH